MADISKGANYSKGFNGENAPVAYSAGDISQLNPINGSVLSVDNSLAIKTPIGMSTIC